MNKKENLKDLTFIIPVRIDSIVRLENLKLVTDYLFDSFQTNIFVLEASPYKTEIMNNSLNKNIDVKWIEDFDPVFHRTHWINFMVGNCITKYIAVWDADVIIPKEQIISSIKLLKDNTADFVSPYKDKFLETSEIIREGFIKNRDINFLKENSPKMKHLYLPEPVGGAFLAKTEEYKKSGLENTNFYGWGVEDAERIVRWTIQGYKYTKIDGELFHLTHSRGKNSMFHADNQLVIKNKELNRIYNMSKEELIHEISSWR